MDTKRHQIVQTTFDDPRVVALRTRHGDEMARLYNGPRHAAEAEIVDPDSILVCLLALDDDGPVGTVALRRLGDLVEVKRMFVVPEWRGTGLARRLLAEVERHAARVTHEVVLHTGERQRAAIGLYERAGYRRIDVYPPYDSVPESVCFAKVVPDDLR